MSTPPVASSAMWNTSVLGLGVLFAPVTAVFGAVVSFNLACILGPPLSAWTAWLWLRRHVGDVPAAFGGLLFGFSPFVIDESTAGHLMLMWLCLLPVMLMLIEDLLWRSPRPMLAARSAPRRRRRRAVAHRVGGVARLRSRMRRDGVPGRRAVPAPNAGQVACAGSRRGAAIGVAGVLCAYPLFEQFGGNRAIRPPIFPIGANAGRLRMLVGAPLPSPFTRALVRTVISASSKTGSTSAGRCWCSSPRGGDSLFRRKGVRIAVVAIVGLRRVPVDGSHWHFAGVSVPAPFRLLQDHVA